MTDALPILWHSNAPWTSSGYGVQTALFCRRIRDAGDNIAISGFFGLQAGRLQWEGIPVFPAGQHGFGIDTWEQHADRVAADAVVFSLIDAWVLTRPERHAWAGWVPVDHDPIPDAVAEKCAQMDVVIAMSRFGEAKMREAGLSPVYLPHAYDPADYYPDEKGGREFRDRIDVPHGNPLIGVVAANRGGFPSRKNLPGVIEAFAMLVQGGLDAYMYAHCHAGPGPGAQAQGAANLAHQADKMGVLDRIRFVDDYRVFNGASPQHMREAYSAMDVLVNPSMGEGFGVPILEAQACGTPVVVGRWTAMGELAFAGAVIEPSEALPHWTVQGSRQWIAGASVIAQSVAGVLDPTKMSAGMLAAQAVAGAEPYRIERVWEEHWPAVRAALVDARAERAGEQVVTVEVTR